VPALRLRARSLPRAPGTQGVRVTATERGLPDDSPYISRRWRVIVSGESRDATVVLTRGRDPSLVCSCNRIGCAHKAEVQRLLDLAATRGA
jgi:hypothetical protein